MILSSNDKLLLRLAGWREARGDGVKAVEAVIFVLVHRAGHPGFAPRLHECILGENQISSMSRVSDPEFFLKPAPDDAIWAVTESLVDNIQTAVDPSNGALYYANLKKIDPGGWFERNISGVDGLGLSGHAVLAVIQKQTFFA